MCPFSKIAKSAKSLHPTSPPLPLPTIPMLQGGGGF